MDTYRLDLKTIEQSLRDVQGPRPAAWERMRRDLAGAAERSGLRLSLPGRAIQAVFLCFRHSRLLAPATMQQRSLAKACSSFV